MDTDIMSERTMNTALAFEYPADLSLDLRNKVKVESVRVDSEPFW